MKIIQINTTSHSKLMEDFETDFFKNWYAQVGFKIKHFYPDLEVECWTPEISYKREKEIIREGVKFRIFPSTVSFRHGMDFSFPLIKALKKEIAKTAKENKRLILHIHEYHSWLAYSILLFVKKYTNVKIVVQHHGGRSPFLNLKKYKRLLTIFPIIGTMQLFENILFKKVDIFYALSDSEINYLKNLAPKSKIEFLTMGIDDVFFENISKKKARKKLGLDLEKRYIIFLGRIKTTKGIRELLDVAKNLNIELLLIGEGPDLKKYKKYANEKRISNAHFLGPVYGTNKLDFLAACDCLVLPSYTEGAPVVLMEAIAKNLPVVATNVGGICKMIKNNREGILINPYSSEDIKKGLNEILNWERKDIKKHADKYKWRKIIDKIVSDYLK